VVRRLADAAVRPRQYNVFIYLDETHPLRPLHLDARDEGEVPETYPQRRLSRSKGATAMIFHDRHDAGRQLAARLAAYANRPDVLVLGLPRGGVPVAFEVAKALAAPLDIFLVRKLGVPGREELAMGAIASGGVRVVNADVVRSLDIPPEVIDRVAAEEERELARREWEYRDDRPPPDVAGKVVLLVDDGLATGSSMRAAVMALRQRGPAEIVVAVPVGAAETCAAMNQLADATVCAYTPEHFAAVGIWYADFSQTTDEEVRELLAAAGKPAAPQRRPDGARNLAGA
jgi:putative phosphoribosyl transferase